MTSRYHIAEWFGRPFSRLAVPERQRFARAALGRAPVPRCPFQDGNPVCSKRGGVCSIQAKGRRPVIACPSRFGEDNLLPSWLARIVGFRDVYVASEVPFMRSPTTGRAAGRVDLVVARDGDASRWFGLETQAVYFSGPGMTADFEVLRTNKDNDPPAPKARRRPDWRSSGAKRLMPQLQVKGPTLRRWGTKLAVAVDRQFFEAIGGPSKEPSRDLDDGDIIWLVPEITAEYRLTEYHWEVLSLEESSDKLISAESIKRQDFEKALRAKLQRVGRAT